jgi:hypothetical protein
MGGTLYTNTKGDPVLYVQDQEKFDLKEFDKWMNELKKLYRDKNVFKDTIFKIKPNGKQKI